MAERRLTVRQDERTDLALPVQFEVTEAHREQVSFSTIADTSSPFTLGGTAIDVSVGGLGLRCSHYLPRMCEGFVRVFSTDSKEGEREVLLEHAVKVRRVTMRDHGPTYGIGVSFVDPPTDMADRVLQLLRRLGVTGGGD